MLLVSGFSSWACDSDCCLFCAQQWASATADGTQGASFFSTGREVVKPTVGKERAAERKYLLGYIFQAAKWLFSQMSHVQGNCR